MNAAADKTKSGFSAEEREAMKSRAAELRAEAKAGKGAKKAAADEAAVRETIAKMASPDREIAVRIHEIVTSTAPELAPKLWYSQPAWARDGKVVCFFRSGQGDKERYSTFGFSTEAALDSKDGLWANAFAVTELTKAGEKTITDLVKKAMG